MQARIGMVAIAALALTGCGKTDTQPTETPSASATVAATATPAAGAAPASFAMCVACHSVEPGKNGLGPSLHGVVGRKAGSQAGFAYSTPLKTANLTWDDATLDKWLEAPMVTVPGNRMTFAGLKDPVKRAEVIAYLATLN